MSWTQQVRSMAGRTSRDLAHIVATLRGQGPPPFQAFGTGRARTAREVAPGASAHGEAAPAITARVVRVVARTEETHDVTSLVLRVADKGPRLRFTPGQFVTVVVERDGETIRRCYSLSGTPTDGEDLCITVKATPEGRLSGWLARDVGVDDQLTIEPPAGRFGVAPSLDARRDLVLIGGGSGVTPLFSVLRSVLRTERESRVLWLDGHRSPVDIIFGEELDRLAEEHPSRLTMRHVVESAAPQRSAVQTAPADGVDRIGRLDRETLGSLLDEAGGQLAAPAYLLCGPAPMMAGAQRLLRERGVDPARILVEHYDRPGAAAVPDGEAGSAIIQVGALEASVVVPSGSTILAAGRAAGLPMPSSCTVGGCAACKVKVVAGAVTMAEPNCLTAQERAEGWALACVARPVGQVTVRVGGDA